MGVNIRIHSRFNKMFYGKEVLSYINIFFIKKILFSSPLDFSSSIFSDMRFLKVGIR